MEHYIQTLINQGEGQYLDFKFEIKDARKIARSMVAFANADGGKLLIGVKDNGAIAGIRLEEEIYMIEAAASYYCVPKLKYSIKKWVLDSKIVLEVDIPEGEKKPYRVMQKNAITEAYIRVDDEDIKACNAHIISWKIGSNKTGVMLNHADCEGKVLDYLSIYAQATLKDICRTLMLNRQQAEQLLGHLVYLRMVAIEYRGDQVLFKLAQPHQ